MYNNSMKRTNSPSSKRIKIQDEDASHRNQWQSTINQCVYAIVSIRFSQVSAFDTEGPDTSEATGFVVDASKGIILTNRHVTCSGPFVGEAIFQDHEEVDVHPIYRDPIHDFGFLRFDPSKIKYMKLHEIPLAPHLAQVGLEIRVVGNDAGEKLSILAGSISRLDRNAPEYGELTYNDFNTFYLQAASSTSGGSSGSPVLDIHGNAVALQAGGHMKAATDFFFPLDRVARALKYLQNDMHVPRGTIQTQFLHRPFDDAKRLGLSEETERLIRSEFPDEIGLLVVEVVLPKGPASSVLEEGDVLVSINGKKLTQFVVLEEFLDSNIQQSIQLTVERGGQMKQLPVCAQDLHSITPDRYLQVGGAKVNNLSYQLARQFCVAVAGVYVAEPSGMFRLDGPEHGWIVASVDTKPTRNLTEFINVIAEIPDYDRIPITFYSILDIHTTKVAIVQMERHWTPFQLVKRNDKSGIWEYEELKEPFKSKELQPVTASFPSLSDEFGKFGNLFQSLVKVHYFMPCKLDGFPKSKRQGAGIVLDKDTGLVLVGKNLVPFAMGDITITVADSIMISASVVFVHPTHNVSVIKYDPSLIGSTPIKNAPLALKSSLKRGSNVNLVALNHNQRPVVVETLVTDISTVTIPLSPTPRFRAINFDAITIDTPLSQQCSSGFLADSKGKIHAFWLSFLGERSSSNRDNEYHLGVGVDILKSFFAKLKTGNIPMLRWLAAEFTTIQLSQARNMGLSSDWIRQVELNNPSKRHLFIVARKESLSPAHPLVADSLEELDIILAVEGRLVTDILDLDVSEHWKESVEITILRSKQEITLTVESRPLDAIGTSRALLWAGALIQEPHPATLLQSKKIPSGIYVSARSKGSPAYMYGITPTTWITHVNSEPVHTLVDFCAMIKSVQDNTYIRLKTMSFDMIPCVLSVKINLHYWPTVWMERDSISNNWTKTVITK